MMNAEKESKSTKGAGFFTRARVRRAALALSLLFLFVMGYGMATSVSMIGRCSAAVDPLKGKWMPLMPICDSSIADCGLSISPTVTGASFINETFCPCAPPFVWPSLCDYSFSASNAGFDGESQDIRAAMRASVRGDLQGAARAMQMFIGNWLVDGMMAALLQRLNQAEMNLIDWWNTFWFYNLYPAMQDMAKQLGVSAADQTRTLQSSVDAQGANEVKRERDSIERDAAHNLVPAENACPVATATGGQARALTIGTAMRKAYQDVSTSRALNTVGTMGASGSAPVVVAQVAKFRQMWCDPEGNGGQNDCAAPIPAMSPVMIPLRNADTQVTKQIYNTQTIDVTNVDDADPSDPGNPAKQVGKLKADTVQALLQNMLGSTSMNPIPERVMMSASGRERFMDRRPFMARYAAAASVPHFLVGRRMPGSNLGQWIAEIRKAAGVSPGEIAQNPSYKEILHALAVDRFNSGKFGMGMINDDSVIGREKLIQQTLYLMQLRDYYELLERTALVLSVQVGILADERPLPSVPTPVN